MWPFVVLVEGRTRLAISLGFWEALKETKEKGETGVEYISSHWEKQALFPFLQSLGAALSPCQHGAPPSPLFFGIFSIIFDGYKGFEE